MKKLIIIAISLLSYINAFCQDHEFVASKEECVNYLMVSLAKQYLTVGKSNNSWNDSEKEGAKKVKESIPNFIGPKDCDEKFENVCSSMKDNNHSKGAEQLIKCKTQLENKLDKATWKSICEDRLAKHEGFVDETWVCVLNQGGQVSAANTENSIEKRIKDFEYSLNENGKDIRVLKNKMADSSSSLPIISIIISVLSLLGVGYLYYMTIIKKVNDDRENDDLTSIRLNSVDLERIKDLEKKCEIINKKSDRIDKALEDVKLQFDDLSKDLKKTQTVQNPPKQEEKQTPAPVKQETTQTVYARTKESGILREVNELSYYTLKIKNGRADVEFSGDSLTAIKNSNQYFDGVYDIADRNGSNKIEIIKIAKAEKQADGTWKVTEKGKLKFK